MALQKLNAQTLEGVLPTALKTSGFLKASDGTTAITIDDSTGDVTLAGDLDVVDITATGTVVGVTATYVGLGNVDNTTDANKPVSTATQTALDDKLAITTAASTYAPIASPTFTGTVAGVTSTHVGLGSVNNTTDANKPVSTATQTALDDKLAITTAGTTYAPLASPALTGTATAVNLTLSGNLTVDGTTTILNTQTVEVEDNILQLNTTQASPDTATAATSGFSVYRGNGVTQASLIFDEADDTWDLTDNLHLKAVSGDSVLKIETVTGGDSTITLKGFANRNNVINFEDNTGIAGRIIYDHNDNEFQFYTNGISTADMVIDSSGNVGIGTASPGVPLHVYSADDDLMHLESSDQDCNFKMTGGSGHFQLSVANNNASFGMNGRHEMLRFSDTTDIVINEDGLDLNFRVEGVGSQNALFVQGSDGKVGIGCTPTIHLDVQTATDVVANFKTTGANSDAMVRIQNDAQPFDFRVLGSDGDKFVIRDANAGVNRLIIDTSGLVTIGNALTVTGAITGGTIAGTLTTVAQPNITSVGTITSGVWNGGIIPHTHGGTGTDGKTGSGSVVLNSGPSIMNPRIYTGLTMDSVGGGNFIMEGSHRIGIGDTSPQGKLEINNRNTATGCALFIKGGEDDLSPIAGQYTGLAFGYGGGDTYNNTAIVHEFINASAGAKLHLCLNTVLNDGTANISDAKLTLSGTNVGIGVTDPEAPLEINGSVLVDTMDDTEGGIFFRPGFVTSSKYNVSIIGYNNSGSYNDGLSINGYNGVSFCTGSNSRQQRMLIDSSGHVTPGGNGTQDLGASGAKWANLWVNDLQLSNEGNPNEIDGTEGTWTVQEGDENLFVINRITGKKFKINLTEV